VSQNHIKLGICNEIFKGWEIEEVFRFIAELGYDGLEIAPYTLADSVLDISSEERKAIVTSAAKFGVEVIGTHWLLVTPPGLSLSTPDGAVRKKSSRYLSSLVEFTGDIGGSLMVLGSPKQRSIGKDQDRDSVEQYMREVLEEPLSIAEERGVFICLEPLSRAETNFINTAEEACAFIARVSHPYLRLILDVKAMSDESLPIPEIFRNSRDYLLHVHANDKNLRGPGSGSVDFQPIISVLREINYSGYLSVEVFDFEEGPEAIARNARNYLKQVYR